jgi:hypothetical protein
MHLYLLLFFFKNKQITKKNPEKKITSPEAGKS